MRLQDLDLNLLVVLDMLLTEEGVTRTARRLRLSQPAISSALRRLREHFRDELLVQFGRRMVLTPRAESLKKPIREMLLQLESVLIETEDFDPSTVQRKVTLVASDYVAAVSLGPFFSGIARLAPRIELHVVPPESPPNGLFDLGETDLHIIPQHFVSGAHPRAVLFRDEYCCVVWRENERVGTSLSRQTLSGLRHVMPGFGERRDQYIARHFLEAGGVTCEAAAFMPSFAMALEALVGTDHVAAVPSKLAEVYARRLPLRVLRCPIELPPIIEVLQWHKHRDRDPLIVWLREQLIESVGRS